MEAFFVLSQLPELTWLDLLDVLNHLALIAENAVVRLHRSLNIPVPDSGFTSDRAIWADILKEKAINENQRVTSEADP